MPPLTGILVLDLTRLLPGGFATLLLADMGASVVKVESLQGGDYMRYMPPPVLFQAVNRGKRSLALDIRSAAGRDAFLRLAAKADVVVEGFRAGTLEKLGLGFDELRRANPRLVVCAMSGYGQQGPLAGRSGHDINFVARAGLLAGLGRAPTIQAADICGGYAAALAVCGALRGRDISGEGAFLDVSLTAAALPMLLTRIGFEQLTGALGCYNVYETADGKHLSVGALEQKFFERFLQAIGRDDLLHLQYEATGQEELKRELAAVFRTRTLDEWTALFSEVDACVEPVLEPDEALRATAGNDPFYVTTPLGRSAALPAPGYGRHTEQVLAECGFSEADIAALHSASAIFQAP